MTTFSHHIAGELARLEEKGLRRRLVPLFHAGGGRVVVDGRSCLNLSGNDYLGLAGDRELADAFYSLLDRENMVKDFAPGSTGSRLMTGNSWLYDRLERLLAALYGKERVLVFNSGYHGNLGILPALAGRGDLIVADKLCHASIIDGIRLAGADHLRYPHLDYDRLERLLAERRDSYNRVFLVTESVFSMDGDLADLPRLAWLKKKFDCVLYVDEAHGVGVFGPQGLGLAERDGVVADIDLLFGTFGKALGGLGGFVACAEPVADYLVSRARPLIYSTGLPPVCLHWLLFVLERLPGMLDRRERLLATAKQLREELAAAGLRTGGASQIIPAIIGDSRRTVAVAERLRENGFWVTAVRPPTVPVNTARLRLSVSSAHDPAVLGSLPGLIRAALEA
ncbi:MAG: 8-amino-7-oxononanoate synthase [Desulfobulbaceae bacterium]